MSARVSHRGSGIGGRASVPAGGADQRTARGPTLRRPALAPAAGIPPLFRREPVRGNALAIGKADRGGSGEGEREAPQTRGAPRLWRLRPVDPITSRWRG